MEHVWLSCSVLFEMEESPLDRELVDVAGEIVEISRRDRDALLQELCIVPGCETIRERFEVGSKQRPVELDGEQRSHLRVVLEVWERDGLPPDGIAGLLAALVRADPHGHVGTASFDR